MSSPPTENGAAETPSQPDEPRSLRIEDWLTVVIMALLALITFANVLVRYFTSSSFAWTEEISVFLMILLAMVDRKSTRLNSSHLVISYAVFSLKKKIKFRSMLFIKTSLRRNKSTSILIK